MKTTSKETCSFLFMYHNEKRKIMDIPESLLSKEFTSQFSEIVSI
ncbi:hypothetical protein EZS27_002155 [termite gut metagenome]|uniref:Uncharacterized protein n=2 Tax=termite gut metagenome TaxID=433724 RepID=A0A5J4SWV3_9ZZZZ